MTNKKSTKKALITSALCLLLCVSMLVGATFAWFTDSVSSAKNKIVAGNLDVELEYAKVVDGQMTAWATVADAANIFDPNALWEPGRVEVVYLKVSNLGTLALKYQLGVNVYNEIPGTNVAGETFKLSDYLVFKTVEMSDALTTYTDREAAQLAAGSAMGLKDYNGATTALEAGKVDYVALIVYMPETVGNEANYRGNAVPTIELGVNLYATQQMAEEDSFGPDYDEDAKLPIGNAEDLAAAMTEGGIYVLAADIAVDSNTAMIVPTGKEVILDLNGHDINAVANATGSNKNVFCVKGDMTVVGNGTLSTVFTGTNMGWGNSTSIFSVEGGELTLGEGVSVINNGGSNMAYGVDVNTTLGESVLNINGATILSTYTAVREFNNHATAKAIVNFNSGIVSGVKRDIWVHNPSAKAVDANGVVNFADGVVSTVTTQGADSYYGRIYTIAYDTVLATPASVQAHIDAGKTNITLTAGEYHDTIVMKSGITLQGTNGAIVDCIALNGASNVTLKNIDFDAAGAQISYDHSGNAKIRANIVSWNAKGTAYKANNVVIDGCTFTGAFANGGAAVAFTDQKRGGDSNITIKNCVFDTTNGVYDIYGHYFGGGAMIIEGNTFASVSNYPEYATCIYLGRYQSSTPVVVKGNTFENKASFDAAADIQAHSADYTVSFDAADNTFNG